MTCEGFFFAFLKTTLILFDSFHNLCDYT